MESAGYITGTAGTFGTRCIICNMIVAGTHICKNSLQFVPAQLEFASTKGLEMQKIKLSDEEKLRIKEINDGIFTSFIAPGTCDAKLAYGIGWLMGLIDRVTE